MTINLTDPANQLTNERLAEIAVDGFLEHGDAKEMARELQERRKSDALPATQPSRMSGIMPDYEGVAMTQRECYQAGKEAGLTEAGRFPVIPSGYALVPVNPTEDMIVEGFESAPDKVGQLELFKRKEYGETIFSFYNKTFSETER